MYHSNLSSFDKIVHSLAQDLISARIHPNYLKINKILRYDSIKTDQCFADKYGNVKNFIKIYRKA